MRDYDKPPRREDLSPEKRRQFDYFMEAALSRLGPGSLVVFSTPRSDNAFFGRIYGGGLERR